MKDQPEFLPEPLRPEFLAEAARRQGWALDSAPLFQTMTRSREMAFSLARFALGAMLLLNLAGLFALPTLAQVLGARLGDHAQLAVSTIAAFVIGLTAAAFATLLAFLAMYRDSAVIYDHIERIGEARGPFGMTADSFVTSKIALERDLRRDQRMRARALRLGGLAFGSFVIGAIFTTMVLASTIPGPPIHLRVETSAHYT
ncbi:MAG: hypothetical protein ACREE3_07470, partial [Stellaceae bacterium]